MRKLLVNTPTGKQEIITVEQGGGYFDPNRVVWDEREDGPLPEGVEPGRLVRTERGLEEDPEFTPTREGVTAEKLRREIDAKRDSLLYANVAVEFPEGEKIIQYRNEKDHRALTSVVMAAMAHIIGGNPSATVSFRTEDDVTNVVRSDSFVAIGMAVMAAKEALYKVAWDKKDSLEGMTQEELNAVDVDAGWPRV